MVKINTKLWRLNPNSSLDLINNINTKWNLNEYKISSIKTDIYGRRWYGRSSSTCHLSSTYIQKQAFRSVDAAGICVQWQLMGCTGLIESISAIGSASDWRQRLPVENKWSACEESMLMHRHTSVWKKRTHTHS